MYIDYHIQAGHEPTWIHLLADGKELALLQCCTEITSWLLTKADELIRSRSHGQSKICESGGFNQGDAWGDAGAMTCNPLLKA